MARIADAAGVAVGTLYRHYPTKTDLVEAVLLEFSNSLMEQLETAAGSVTKPHDAVALIERFLAGFVEMAASNHAVKAAAHVLNMVHATDEQMDRGRVALDLLVAAGQSDGDIRPGVTAEDIYLIMISAPASFEKPALDRWLEICLGGIRAR